MTAIVWQLFSAILFAAAAVLVFPTVRGTLGAAGTLGVAVAFAASLGAAGAATDCGGALFAAIRGAVVALPFALFFESLSSAGRLLDLLRGSQHAEVLLQVEARGSALEHGAALVTLCLIFESGIYLEAVERLRMGYLETALNAGITGAIASLFEGFVQSVLFIAPALLALASLELFAFLLSRMEPRGGLWNEILGLKLVVGLGGAGYLFWRL